MRNLCVSADECVHGGLSSAGRSVTLGTVASMPKRVFGWDCSPVLDSLFTNVGPNGRHVEYTPGVILACLRALITAFI